MHCCLLLVYDSQLAQRACAFMQLCYLLRVWSGYELCMSAVRRRRFKSPSNNINLVHVRRWTDIVDGIRCDSD